MKKIAISTGGGDCPGLNAVIRAVYKTAKNKYGYEVIGIEDGFDGLIKPNKLKYLTSKDISGIICAGGTILGTTNRGNPFEYKTVDKNGTVKVHNYSKRVINKLKELEVGALILIGGDGTLKIGREFFDLGVPVIGVPKTIDNDLMSTDVTFGFDTAVNTATFAIDKLRTTAESHHRVMVVEVMGRDAGWIALEAGIAGGADVILIPEIPYKINEVCKKVIERQKRDCKSTIVVVSEGAYPKGTEKIYLKSKDKTANKRLGGVGAKVGADIESKTGFETRVTVLGHIQRGGSPTARDRVLSTVFGSMAAELAHKGEFGKMVAIQGGQYKAVSLLEATGKQKLVSLDDEIVKSARRIGIELGD